METVTIRELRQSWPAVEKRLAAAGELTITRDGVAVAVLAPARKAAATRTKRRFDPTAHAKLLKEIWGNEKPAFSSDELLAAERAERDFFRRPK